jgi:hypothetical protein
VTVRTTSVAGLGGQFNSTVVAIFLLLLRRSETPHD